MELTRSTLKTVVKGKSVTIYGEAFLPGFGSPDFQVFTNSIKTWDDGSEITESEKDEIIQQILKEAKKQGINIEMD